LKEIQRREPQWLTSFPAPAGPDDRSQAPASFARQLDTLDHIEAALVPSLSRSNREGKAILRDDLLGTGLAIAGDGFSNAAAAPVDPSHGLVAVRQACLYPQRRRACLPLGQGRCRAMLFRANLLRTETAVRWDPNRTVSHSRIRRRGSRRLWLLRVLGEFCRAEVIVVYLKLPTDTVLEGSRSIESRKLRNHPPTFKAQVELAVMKGDRTLAEPDQRYGHQRSQITDCMAQLSEWAAQIFDGPKPEPGPNLKELHAKISQLTLEEGFLEGAMLGGFFVHKSDLQLSVKMLWLDFASVRDFVESAEHMWRIQDQRQNCV
jgi:transposase